MRMYSAYSDPQKDQTVKILVKYIQIDITILFFIFPRLGRRERFEETAQTVENIAGGVRAPSVVRSLESASATGTWRHVYGDVFNFLWGSNGFFEWGYKADANGF